MSEQAKDCEVHRILRFNAANAQCEIACPYCRIAELKEQITEIPQICRTYEKRIKELEAKLKENQHE